MMPWNRAAVAAVPAKLGKDKEAHEIKSCNMGTLRYKADIPLNERRGSRVGIGPPREELVAWANSVRSGGSSDTDTDRNVSESGLSSDMVDSD